MRPKTGYRSNWEALSAACMSLVLLTETGALGQATWVRQYGEVLGNAQYNVTPEDVQTTSEGGYIALGQSTTSRGQLSWLVKLDSFGASLWQKNVGVPGLPPGSYAIGVSVQQTADEGYIIGGGTIGGGSGDDCPSLSGIECVWLTKVDSDGELIWSRAYRAGRGGSGMRQIRNTNEGGYVGAGYSGPSSTSYGALLIKFDSLGSVVWQRLLGPDGATNAVFNAVQQTSDRGFVAAGELYSPGSGLPRTTALVVKFDSNGNVEWQGGYNNFDESESPTGSQRANSILQTADDGYLVAGGWGNPVTPSGSDALLLKLDSSGNVDWQTAYDGGVYCYFDGYSTRCARIGGSIYSVGQAVDGGYVLAGASRQIFRDSVPLEGWLAKTDSGGALLWQYLYYPILPRTGRPLGEYFASVALGSDGGFTAIGFSEIYDLQRSDLYLVKTDESGLVRACGEVWDAPRLTAINPAITAISASLPVDATVTPGVSSPSTTSDTSITTPQNCGTAPGFQPPTLG